ncbi:NAD-dependent epimerase/dehydratase family protein [Burkholderia pseudomallei]|nr:NAD-dependent epimerase/dehydratase family protein [Burkholderia pseudomallei]
MLIWKTALSLTWKAGLVSPASAPAAAAHVDRVVLTGATGFIGGAVLVSLVNAGLLDRVVCIVRACDRAHALARLRAAALRSGLAPYWAERLSEANVIAGELGGALADADAAHIALASHVIHCAGVASLADARIVNETNVGATLRFARRFAGSRRLQRFVHVGAAFACGLRARGTIREDDTPARGREIDFAPYTRGKRDAEAQLRALGLPLVVVRPSCVVGHTLLGTQPSASTFWMFRIVHAARRFTARPMARIDVIAVDDCARALMLLALKPSLAHDTYHVSAGDEAPTVTQIVRAMDEAVGLDDEPRYALCSPAEFPSIARDVLGRRDAPRERVIRRALQSYAAFAELDHVFDNARVRREIDFEPLPFVDYVNECMRTSRGIDVLAQMPRTAARSRRRRARGGRRASRAADVDQFVERRVHLAERIRAEALLDEPILLVDARADLRDELATLRRQADDQPALVLLRARAANQAVALHSLQHAREARAQDAAALRDLPGFELMRRFAVQHANDPPLLLRQRKFLQDRPEPAHQRFAGLEQQHGQIAVIERTIHEGPGRAVDPSILAGRKSSVTALSGLSGLLRLFFSRAVVNMLSN